MLSNINTIPNYSMIEESFDLDEALTMNMPNNTMEANVHKDLGQQMTDTRLLSSELPTVADAVGVCTVCLEDFRSEFRGKQVPCGHLYHESCIATWLSFSNSCPLCRSQCIIDLQPSS
ncbi:hypothetical protein LWI29_031397 [Acer saccharum]|uniref:RING-type E3 ubiquitin transferase n=1 Tax=Acer saccharum TaxID=4024 RepID=A0AA39VAH2_ACESA|nr:hypothetical protein LWI29_031397 [Acer saccharum]KAK1591787.1 hypothetical protein Q3G72_013706 [Acer saccharum]